MVSLDSPGEQKESAKIEESYTMAVNKLSEVCFLEIQSEKK